MQTHEIFGLQVLCTFFDWHPARIATFAELILAIIKARTIRIKELAAHVTSKGARHASVVKIERLLLKQAIDMTAIGMIITKLLGLCEALTIAIDRTNWQFGEKNLNFLVAAVVYKNMSIPIVWIMLDKKGNSSAQEREELIEKLLTVLLPSTIKVVVADREFACEEWIKYLQSKTIPFALRLKKNEQMSHSNGGKMKLERYFSKMQKGEVKEVNTSLYSSKIRVKITCMQLEQEQLFVASNTDICIDVLSSYKDRWGIERSFKALKTAGFNMEDTHITDLKKLEKIFALASIALTICIIAGDIKNNIVPIKVKNHGKNAYSIFTYGFDLMRDFFTKKVGELMELTQLLTLLRLRIQTCIQINVG